MLRLSFRLHAAEYLHGFRNEPEAEEENGTPQLCNRNKYLSLLCEKKIVSVRFIFIIVSFQVTIPTNFRALTSCMNVNYVVGHEELENLFLQCIVSILWVLIISWCGYTTKCGILHKRYGLQLIIRAFYLGNWWYLVVNKTVKINQSNCSHWFYLIVATCFGQHLGPSSGNLVKYVSCYWTVLI
jgi:hypothetical protein